MPTCMAESDEQCCPNEATSFRVLGSLQIPLCWCCEHSGVRLDGERSVSEDEWLAIQAMQEVHGA